MDQVLVDKAMLKYCKRRSTKLAMVWIDYQKAYDLIPPSWISEWLEVYGVAKNFVVNSMNKWKLELASNVLSLGNFEIWRGIFQGDSLSTLLFVLRMIPLSLIFKKVKFRYKFCDKKTRINHLLFMANLKLIAKSNDRIDSLFNTVCTFSEDIGMEFGIKKCRLLVLKWRKSDISNETKAIKSWAVAIMRYGAGVLEWKFDELKELDWKTRKLLTIHKELHPKSDLDSTIRSEENNLR